MHFKDYENHLRFKIIDSPFISEITQWISNRVDQGYDLHWDKNQYTTWAMIPSTNDALTEFLSLWGDYVIIDVRRV